MSDRRLRWGLICTARINGALIPAIGASDRSELVAVASRELARADHYARQWGIPRAHGSYEALLADPEVDVIYNALPNSLHCEWTVKAADAGKHILCEKPLALTVEEVDRMTEAARRSGVVLLEAFMYRFHPQTLKVQELVTQGVIGDVRLVRAVFSYTLARPGDVRLDPTLGGGSLWDVGCYPVSFARAIAGSDPVEVSGWQVLGDSGVDLTFVGQMRFADGTLAQFDSSFQAASRWGAEVVGSQGTLVLDNPWKPGADGSVAIRLHFDNGTETMPVEDVDAYLCEVEDMADCILDGSEPVLPVSDSRGNVATLNALYESARTGQAVSLST
ncbi:MAG: Gfo/Idh/MocA family protein [Anaerolineae bacterium]